MPDRTNPSITGQGALAIFNKCGMPVGSIAAELHGANVGRVGSGVVYFPATIAAVEANASVSEVTHA